jgi:hypothetical protein
MNEKGSLMMNNIKVLVQAYPTLNKIEYKIRLNTTYKLRCLQPQRQPMENPVLGRGK